MSNTITVTGNIVGSDPVLRFSKTGTAFCNFSLSDSRKVDDAWESQFFNCTAFKFNAEAVAMHLRKGMRVHVTGRLQEQKYTNKDGVEKTSMQITVNDIYMALPKVESETSGAATTKTFDEDELASIDDLF